MTFLDPALQRFKQTQLARMTPCPPSRILKLERQIGTRFPAAYREFLQWGGEDCGDLFPMSAPYFLYLDPKEHGYNTHASAVYDKLPIFNQRGRGSVRMQVAESLGENAIRMAELLNFEEGKARAAIESAQLPDDRLVFLMFTNGHDWIEGRFFRPNEGEDPPIYRFWTHQTGYARIADRFSAFLLDEINGRALWSG